jgi:hypothetical protein
VRGSSRGRAQCTLLLNFRLHGRGVQHTHLLSLSVLTFCLVLCLDVART